MDSHIDLDLSSEGKIIYDQILSLNKKNNASICQRLSRTTPLKF